MQMFIDRLPMETVYSSNGVDEPLCYLQTLRHWLVYPDGRIFFQDERIRVTPGTGKMEDSERGDWHQLPTPPQQDIVQGVFTYGGLPGVVTHSGQAYIWAAQVAETQEQKQALELLRQANSIHEWPHMWVPFAAPVPNTIRDL